MPDIRFAEAEGVNVAYHVVGAGKGLDGPP
jgi:hypothetical protein